MSQEASAIVAKLRKRFAGTFNLQIGDICEHTYPNGETEVWCPGRPDLPKWSTGELSNP